MGIFNLVLGTAAFAFFATVLAIGYLTGAVIMHLVN